MMAIDTTYNFHGKRVLIVEDEAMIAMQLEFDLEDLGCEVIGPAPSVQSALQLIEQETVDAAVLDFRLGDETSSEIAAALIGRNVPFAFMTGHALNDLPSELRRHICLQKPVMHQLLISALTAIMQTRPA